MSASCRVNSRRMLPLIIFSAIKNLLKPTLERPSLGTPRFCCRKTCSTQDIVVVSPLAHLGGPAGSQDTEVESPPQLGFWTGFAKGFNSCRAGLGEREVRERSRARAGEWF